MTDVAASRSERPEMARAPLLDDDDAALFPKLTDAQVQLLRALGEVRATRSGEVLFRAGDATYDVMVVLEGSVSVIVGSGSDERELAVQRPGDLMVELNLLTGQVSGATGLVREPGSVLAIPSSDFRTLLGRELSFGDFVLQMLFRRRQALERLQLGLRIVGSRFDRDTQRLREFAVRNRLLHEWVDSDDPRARAWLGEIGVDELSGPVVLLGGGRFLTNPTSGDFADAVGLHSEPLAPDKPYDLVVVGGGPAGLSASVYAAAGGLSTALLDAVALGGQAATSGRIENYLGFPAGISGAELAERAQIQARKFGVDVRVPRRAVGLQERNGFHVVALEDGDALLARSVVLAMGVHYRRLPVPDVGRYEGLGVAHAVDVARQELAAGGSAVVVGGANSAGQAALSLAHEGHRTFLVVRASGLEASMARYLRERIASDPAVEVLLDHEVRAVGGDGRLARVTVEETATGARRVLDASALVVLIGAEPPTAWLGSELVLDDHGFVLTGPSLGAAIAQSEPWRALGRAPFLVETSRPGVFAIGDVRSGSTRMVAPAAGEGGMAVRFVGEHLARVPTR
jgi:thioredoxin reductase (NADPH)